MLTLLITSGCWRLGDAIPSDALVTWVAYPETVRVDAPFSFEFAGPVSPDGCGRLDTATLAVTESSIELAARRSTFRAMCAPQHISFYEARPLTIGTPGEYVVRAPTGIELGTLVATDTGRFLCRPHVGRGHDPRGGRMLAVRTGVDRGPAGIRARRPRPRASGGGHQPCHLCQGTTARLHLVRELGFAPQNPGRHRVGHGEAGRRSVPVRTVS